MKKWIWIGAVAVEVIFFYATYNGFVNKEEGLKGAWADVETQYQRRADLIPNLVSTVKPLGRQVVGRKVDRRGPGGSHSSSGRRPRCAPRWAA